MERLQAVLEHDGADEGRLAFVGALFRASPVQLSLTRAAENHSAAIVATVRAGLHSSEAGLRRAACDVLASPGFPFTWDGAAGCGFPAVDEAIRLAGGAEEDAEVRTAASRALGFLAKAAGLGGEVSRA